jgi:hypothetical protein
MKNSIIKTSLAAASIAMLALTGCTKDFEEINTNPNNMSVGMATPYNIIEYLEYEPAQWLEHYTWYYNNELVQYCTYYGSLRQYHLYKFSNSEFSVVWNGFARFAYNAVHMQELAEKDGDKACWAVATTLKVLYASNQVSMFGDIPYSEAFQLTDNLQPKFDTQKEVFEQMFEELEEANKIYAAKPTFDYPSRDGIYGGDMTKWRKFNNSLYLRLLCRVSGRSEMNVGEKMTEIVQNPNQYPIFGSNEDNAQIIYSGVAPYVNYNYDTTQTSSALSCYRFTEQMRKLMVDDDVYLDPRISIMYKKSTNSTYNPDGNWLGAVAGGTDSEILEANLGKSYFNYDLYYMNPTLPSSFMNYDEVEFILAEAAVKGLIPGGLEAAKEYYNNGLKGSVEHWIDLGSNYFGESWTSAPKINEEKVEYFYNEGRLAAWDNSGNKLELIGNQKYIALHMVGFEGFHEIHRTGYPELTIGKGTVYNDYIFPTRFAYPANTVATNYNNCMEALSRMGGDNDMKTPLWWSKQAIESGK